MNKTQTMDLLDVLRQAYPKFFIAEGKDDLMKQANVWYLCLMDYDFTQVQAAAISLIKTLKFPPTIADITESLYNLNNPDQPTELEAWNTVKKVLGKAYYQTIECWDKLSPLVQRAVGSPSELKVWSNENIDTLNSVIASNFQRSYRAIAQTQKENTKINNLQLGNKKLKEIE